METWELCVFVELLSMIKDFPWFQFPPIHHLDWPCNCQIYPTETNSVGCLAFYFSVFVHKSQDYWVIINLVDLMIKPNDWWKTSLKLMLNTKQKFYFSNVEPFFVETQINFAASIERECVTSIFLFQILHLRKSSSFQIEKPNFSSDKSTICYKTQIQWHWHMIQF